jgi:hypothetical protein
MTAEAFRKLALALPDAEESAHGNHPDFRAGGRVFASLGYPDNDHGMVKLTPEQQADFMEKTPAAFAPCRGTWGLRGATCVHLASVTKSTLQPALEAAHLNVSTPAKRKPRS